jgi:hypothetical protein
MPTASPVPDRWLGAGDLRLDAVAHNLRWTLLSLV